MKQQHFLTGIPLIIVAFFTTILLVANFDRILIDGIHGELAGLLFKTDTKYAENYSHSKFKKIKTGMNEAEVSAIIGEPICKWHTFFLKNGECVTTDTISFQYSESPGDTHYRLRQIYFFEGKVAEKDGYFYID